MSKPETGPRAPARPVAHLLPRSAKAIARCGTGAGDAARPAAEAALRGRTPAGHGTPRRQTRGGAA